MNITLAASLITALGGIIAAVATYAFTKARELDAELKKERLEYYKTFLESISGILAGESSDEGQETFSRACNNLLLFAPSSVLNALYDYQYAIKEGSETSHELHDKLLTSLLLAIRHDLGIRHVHDSSFTAKLFSAGTKRKRVKHEGVSP